MKRLIVKLKRSPDEFLTVGTIADDDKRSFFEYDPAFIDTGLQLSPLKLPLGPGLRTHEDLSFGPLPGLFADSLPDGWGLLLIDRVFRQEGFDPATLSPIDRLAWLGTATMGALTYHPPRELAHSDRQLHLYELGKNAADVLAGDAAEVLPELIRAGGSPGGARPKVLVGVQGDRIVSGEDDLPDDFEHWIVKFAGRADARDAGPAEYAYGCMAKAAGIDIPPIRLFEVRRGRSRLRYFGVRRFDRKNGNRRIHVHTFANLLHIDFRLPQSDYADLFKVTQSLTRNHGDALRLFRLMVFNVAAHNRDDHAKNFAFMLDDRLGEWSLAPAYDLTFSPGPGGEHSTTLLGEGRQPTREHCLKLAKESGIRSREAEPIFDAVNTAITRWREFAADAHCTKKTTEQIAKALRRI